MIDYGAGANNDDDDDPDDDDHDDDDTDDDDDDFHRVCWVSQSHPLSLFLFPGESRTQKIKTNQMKSGNKVE